MKVNPELMFTRRKIKNKAYMRRLSQEVQTLGLMALLKKVNKMWERVAEGVLYHKCW